MFYFLATSAGCGDKPAIVWGVEQSEFLSRVRSGSIGFLLELNYSKVRLEEVFRLGEGAGLYVSIMLGSAGLRETELRLLRLEWEQSGGIFKREAGRRLSRAYIEDSDYENAERFCETFLRRYPDDPDMKRRLIESRYWQQKDSVVLKALAEFRSKEIPFSSPEYPEEELLLWEAVSGYRKDVPGWENLFRKLFFNFPASKIHVRAYEFIALAEPRLNRFHTDELAAFAGKAKTWAQEYGNAATLFGTVLVPDSSIIRSAWLVREAGRSFQGAGRSLEGAGIMASLVPILSGSELLAAEEIAGRLYRAAGRYDLAEKYLDLALSHSIDAESYDRILWYKMSSQIRKSSDAAAMGISAYASSWKDPEYFSDLLDEICRSSIARSRWDLIWNVYGVLEKNGPASSVSQYAVVLAAALRAKKFSVPGKPSSELIRTLYSKALAGGSPYYRFLASSALGVPIDLQADAGPAMQPAEPGSGIKKTEAASRYDPVPLLAGFLAFGLHDEGYSMMERYLNTLAPDEVISLAREFFDTGRFYEGLRLVTKIHNPKRFPYSRDVLEMLFPRAYREYIDAYSGIEKYPASFLYGLVKEESYFSPSVVSSAGAVGLSQLIPSTAKDVGGRIGLKNPVLTDPAVNLKIGSRYLGMLLERYRSPLYALAGYNAGYGRIKTWIDQWGTLPPELFAERLPYEETRMYIHKVVVAAVFYAWLYEDRGIDATVSYFFPEIRLQ